MKIDGIVIAALFVFFFVPCVPWLVGDDYKGNFPMKEESL